MTFGQLAHLVCILAGCCKVWCSRLVFDDHWALYMAVVQTTNTRLQRLSRLSFHNDRARSVCRQGPFVSWKTAEDHRNRTPEGSSHRSCSERARWNRDWDIEVENGTRGKVKEWFVWVWAFTSVISTLPMYLPSETLCITHILKLLMDLICITSWTRITDEHI